MKTTRNEKEFDRQETDVSFFRYTQSSMYCFRIFRQTSAHRSRVVHPVVYRGFLGCQGTTAETDPKETEDELQEKWVLGALRGPKVLREVRELREQRGTKVTGLHRPYRKTGNSAHGDIMMAETMERSR